MKTFNQLKIMAVLFLSVAFFTVHAQTGIKAMVDAKNFVFKAQTASPMTGTPLQLSAGYDLTVSKDHIVAYLPYFGRATTAPIDPTDGGIKFTSQSYVYNVTAHKGGGWDVLIDLKDVPAVRTITITFFDNGSATLDVTSNQRDPISFRGRIEAFTPQKTAAKK
jgi:hypothetical protein